MIKLRTTRLRPLNCAVVVLLFLGASSLLAPTLLAQTMLAQTRTTTVPGTTTAPTRIPGAVRGHQQPCWQQAGISQSAMQQRRQIEESTRAQIRSLCSDSALTPQQKREKIRQLREQTRQQVEGLISPAQQQELRACQQERNAARGGHVGGVPHGGGLGPCGELASGKASGQQAEPEHEPEPEQK